MPHVMTATDVVIAIDVGGTGIKCALVDTAQAVCHTERHETGRQRGEEAVRDTILSVAGGLARTAIAKGWRPVAAAVVVPGIIDEPAGTVRSSANLGFTNLALRQLVAERLSLPTVLGHDVRAGGMAEARLGAGQGRGQVLVVPIGTGIAAAHVVDGAVATGAHGAAGEIGHVVVRPGGPLCGCGQRGCLEAIASASAIERRYAELADGTVGRITAAAVVARLDTDPIAKQVWADAVDALADGLLIAQTLYDPELVIIGGGLAESGETLLAPLRDTLAKKITFHRMPEIVRARLGDEAGSLGAALLALDLHRNTDRSTGPTITGAGATDEGIHE